MVNYFEGQNDGEEVIFIFRRHPIVMRKGFYMLLIPFLIASLPMLFWPDTINSLWVALAGLGVGLLLFLHYWIGWYFSIFIVTTERIRQITQRGFFNRSVIDIGISKIQNISYNVPGFTATLLGFGNLVIQTYVGDLYLDKIHRPVHIYESLQKVIRRYGKEEEILKNYEEATQ